MFRIKATYKVDSEIPLIIDNYVVIHFDEIPILYTGTNEYGDRIIGSICQETETVTRYIHTIVKNKEYSKFITKKISYRNSLKNSKRIFILDKNLSNQIIASYELPIEQLPDKYFPHEDSFCPNTEFLFGSQFSISLKGKLADNHEAYNSPVVDITKNAYQILKDIADTFKIRNISPEIHQVASTAASFKINFIVYYKSKGNMFFNEKILNNHISNFIDYSINKLPVAEEAQRLINNEIEGSEFERIIETPLQAAYQSLGMKYDNSVKRKAN